MMPSRLKLFLPALALCASAFATGAHAQSIDIRVLGSVKPPSCVPTLSNGGVVNYGRIEVSRLKKTEYTALENRDLFLSIDCIDRTLLALKTTDNRSSSRIPGILRILGSDWGDGINYGLGTSKDVKVGGYSMALLQGTYAVDGNSANTVSRTTTGQTWRQAGHDGTVSHSGWYYSWSTTDNNAPTAFKNLTGTLRVWTVLNKADELPLSGDVELDGSATLELVYL